MYQVNIDYDETTMLVINFLKEAYTDAVSFGYENQSTIDSIKNVLLYLTPEKVHGKLLEELLIKTDGITERDWYDNLRYLCTLYNISWITWI